MSKNAALAFNQRLPFTRDATYPADPFHFAGSAEDRAQARDCLAAAIYYEAANQSEAGQEAVAQVVLNRTRHPAFPSTVCGVVYQGASLPTGCQFSFTCDGALLRDPDPRGWARALRLADAALRGFVFRPVGWSTHYHADYVVPYWASSLAKSAEVGEHIFYRWSGAAGTEGAFSRRRFADEPNYGRMRVSSLISHGVWPAQVAQVPALKNDRDPIYKALFAEPLLVGILASLTPRGSAWLARPAAAASAAKVEVVAASLHVASADAGRGPEIIAESANGAEPAEPFRPAVVTSDPSAVTEPPADDPAASELIRKLQARPAVYRRAAAAAAEAAGGAISAWEIYTGDAVDRRTLVHAMKETAQASVCRSDGAADRGAWSWLGNPDRAALFMALSFAGQLPAARVVPDRKQRSARALANIWDDQIAMAVFARIAALSEGQDTADRIVRARSAMGYAAVPELERRLRFFERHPERYPDLASFTSALVRGLVPSRRTTDRGSAAESICSEGAAGA